MRVRGEGAAQNFADAVQWLRRAAQQGHTKAQHALGLMLYHGQGVAQDYPQAYVWLALAARQDEELHAARDQVTRKLTPVQLEQAQAQVLAWQPKRERPPASGR